MSTLHTINKSPFSHSTLSSCLQVCGKNDGILLLDDGVFGALKSAPCAMELTNLIAAGLKVYALEPDINARGLGNKVRDDITITDYSGFVKLSIDHSCVQSWY